MKLSEFQDKLTTVSDSKLRRMLADSREKGPEVAVELILAEAGRRGMNPDEPAPAATEAPAVMDAPGGGEAADIAAADGSADAPPAFAGEDVPAGAAKGAWLQEEQHAGMPAMVKVLLVLIILAVVLGGLFFILTKGA